MKGKEDYSLFDMRLAYAAGLFDGEGCVGAYKDKRNGRPYSQIQMQNNNKALVQFLADIFGGNVNKGTRRAHQSQSYLWACFGKHAASVLTMLYPYLIGKKAQAKLAIEFVDATRQRRLEIVTEMHKLNQAHRWQEEGDEVL